MTDNPSDNRERLLLIVLTDAAKQALERSNIIDGGIEERIGELEEHLKNLDRIDLFKLPGKKNKGDCLVALPVNDGEYTLLLKFDDNEDENYFVCIGIDTNRAHPVEDEEYCHRLGGNVRCVLLDTDDGTWRHSCAMYQEDAVSHAEIFAVVAKKKYWRRFEGDSIEERKWRTYLELHKEIFEAKKVSFFIKEVTRQGGKLRAQLDDAYAVDLEKIEGAEGEELHFSLPDYESDAEEKELGKLVSFRAKKNLVVELDKSFDDSLEALIVASQVEDDQDEPAEGEAGETAPAEKKKGAKKKKFPVPARMHVSANFAGDLSQLTVMEHALKKIKNHHVWGVLSGERVAKLPEETYAPDLSKGRMNEEQKAAVNGALNAPELFLIWGPPGTGKTEVIMEIAKQEALRKGNTLICSQANLAVDNALARLYGEPQVYPFRIAKKGYELEGEDRKKVPFADSTGRFFLAELQKKLEQKLGQKNAHSTEDASIRRLRTQFLTRVKSAQKACEKKEKKSNPAEVRQHGELYKKNINVVGTTLMKAESARQTGIKKFDTVIIDEVSKATPPELFVPVSLGKRLVLVGDHKQLPPMSDDHRTQEDWAKEANIPVSDLDTDSTIFQRLWERHDNDASPVRAMLTKQYRMHPDIQALIEQFYTDSEGTLSFGFGDDHGEIAKLILQKVDFCKERPAIWIDTKRESLESKVGNSFVNNDEVKKVGKLLDILAASGDRDMSVGVITFYGAQLRVLRRKYERNAPKFGDGKLIFGTVDRFQGRECDVIICSLVRNNKRRNIGFASKINRINVAFSRAKKSLIILGRSEMFCYGVHNPEARAAYKKIYDNCEHPKPKELDGWK